MPAIKTTGVKQIFLNFYFISCKFRNIEKKLRTAKIPYTSIPFGRKGGIVPNGEGNQGELLNRNGDLDIGNQTVFLDIAGRGGDKHGKSNRHSTS